MHGAIVGVLCRSGHPLSKDAAWVLGVDYLGTAWVGVFIDCASEMLTQEGSRGDVDGSIMVSSTGVSTECKHKRGHKREREQEQTAEVCWPAA